MKAASLGHNGVLHELLIYKGDVNDKNNVRKIFFSGVRCDYDFLLA